jgi:hypothetical protein
MKTPPPPPSRPDAFSLIEVTLALGIAAFCLLTVFGLLPIGLNTTQSAIEQTTVSGIATEIAADLHGTPVAGGTSAFLGLVIPIPGYGQTQQTIYFSQDGQPTGGDYGTTSSGNGSATKSSITVGSEINQSPVAGSNPSRYRATITIAPDAYLTAVNQQASLPPPKLYHVWIFVTWPALGDPDYNKFPSNYAGSYEAVTDINCN